MQKKLKQASHKLRAANDNKFKKQSNRHKTRHSQSKNSYAMPAHETFETSAIQISKTMSFTLIMTGFIVTSITAFFYIALVT